MGSSVTCFGESKNFTLCISLVAATCTALTMLFAAMIVFCCVWWTRRQLRAATPRTRLPANREHIEDMGDLEVRNYVYQPTESLSIPQRPTKEEIERTLPGDRYIGINIHSNNSLLSSEKNNLFSQGANSTIQ